MKRFTHAVLPELDRREMLEVVGGEDGTSFWRDLGYLIGYTVGVLGQAWDLAPESSYAYGKVGYSG